MLKLNIFIFICLYISSIEEFEEDIVEGTKSFTLEKQKKYIFTFNAVKDGTYTFIFPGFFSIYDSNTKNKGDIDFASGFFSYIYVQNFLKGDYIKISYPYNPNPTENTIIKIRIDKIDGDFKLTSRNPIIFTMMFNDCQKPLYIFTFNNQPSLHENLYTFNGKIHSGKFKASYRTNSFNPENSIHNNLTDLEISSSTTLPLYSEFDMVKLQCIEPGIISIYIVLIDSFSSILDEKINVVTINYTYGISHPFSQYKFPINFYIQGYFLAGNASIYLMDFGGDTINNDYIKKIHIETKSKELFQEFYYKESKSIPMILSYCNAGESNDKILEEKKKITIAYNKRDLIQIKNITDKRYIKIKSSLKEFYWDYLYSQTDDINYLPKADYSSMHFEKGKVVYIDNLYTDKNFTTNYYWYISLIHYNYYKNSTFNFEYTNEKNEDNHTKVWVFIIIISISLIIIIGLVICYFIRKKRMESYSNIEALVNKI